MLFVSGICASELISDLVMTINTNSANIHANRVAVIGIFLALIDKVWTVNLYGAGILVTDLGVPDHCRCWHG